MDATTEDPAERATVIALFADTATHARHVRRILIGSGYVCRSIWKLDKLMSSLEHEQIDLLILIGLDPDSDVMPALKQIRARFAPDLPVLFVGEPRTAADETAALDAGADDYVVKSRSSEILLVRVASLLRRSYQPKMRKPVRFGAYEFDMGKCTVTLHGKAITLTQREFALAELLFQHAGVPLSRTQIVESVWHQTANATSRTVDTHISWLRTKLQLCPENGYVIIAVYGYGYCLERLGTAQPS